ncbi:MAG: histidine phosphatase family protein, partial [Butyricicoccaceae bacterium]
MSTTVYLIRHAEAEGNVYRRCHGQYNSLLTPRGLKQAQCLAERMRDVHLDAVYSSDLERARRTAQAVADTHGLPVQTRPGMREIDMGKWEDIPWAGFAKFDKAAYDVWCDTPWLSHLEGGETIMQAGHRAYDELKRIAAENDGKTVAVVGHGTAIRGILTLANGLPDEKMMEVGWGDNTCIAKLIFDGDAVTVEYQNDNSHVPQELSTFASLKWSADKDVPV